MTKQKTFKFQIWSMANGWSTNFEGTQKEADKKSKEMTEYHLRSGNNDEFFPVLVTPSETEIERGTAEYNLRIAKGFKKYEALKFVENCYGKAVTCIIRNR